MRVFVPFTKLRSETYNAIPGATIVPLIDRRNGYWNYFKERWREGKSFINIEQDVVPPDGFLFEMWQCQSDICFASYIYPGQPERLERGTYLGCAKIGQQFILKHPNLFNEEIRDWHAPEGRIWNAVEPKPPCYHDSVLHLHIDSRWPIEEINRYG